MHKRTYLFNDLIHIMVENEAFLQKTPSFLVKFGGGVRLKPGGVRLTLSEAKKGGCAYNWTCVYDRENMVIDCCGQVTATYR